MKRLLQITLAIILLLPLTGCVEDFFYQLFGGVIVTNPSQLTITYDNGEEVPYLSFKEYQGVNHSAADLAHILNSKDEIVGFAFSYYRMLCNQSDTIAVCLKIERYEPLEIGKRYEVICWDPEWEGGWYKHTYIDRNSTDRHYDATKGWVEFYNARDISSEYYELSGAFGFTATADAEPHDTITVTNGFFEEAETKTYRIYEKE